MKSRTLAVRPQPQRIPLERDGHLIQTPPYALRFSAAAEFIGLGESTLRELVAARKIPSCKLGPNRGSPRVIRIQDLAAFIDAHLDEGNQQ